jgi:hypothetical protein
MPVDTDIIGYCAKFYHPELDSNIKIGDWVKEFPILVEMPTCARFTTGTCMVGWVGDIQETVMLITV